MRPQKNRPQKQKTYQQRKHFVKKDKGAKPPSFDQLLRRFKMNKITIIGKGESCPTAVSVANVITQNILNGKSITDKILVDSEILDDGRLIPTIEIMILKINSQ